jgi:hypothetical protein
VAYEYNSDGIGATETTDLAPDAGPTPRIDFP